MEVTGADSRIEGLTKPQSPADVRLEMPDGHHGIVRSVVLRDVWSVCFMLWESPFAC